VNDLFRMGGSHAVAQLNHQLHFALEVDRHFVEVIGERPPAQQFHHDEWPARILAEVVNRDHVPLTESRGRLRLPEETRADIRFILEIGVQKLDRHLASGVVIDGSKHTPHRTATDEFKQAILSDRTVRGGKRGVRIRTDGRHGSSSLCARLASRQRAS
jgi:hypothetical protein